jgi:copper chaperone CopZ
MTPDLSLPLIQGDGCACCAADTTTAKTSTTKETTMDSKTFPVTGMTCGHCVSAVTSEIKEIPGVTDVNIQLVPGGSSTVTVSSDSPLTDEQIAAALDEAGDYQLANA